MNLKEIQDAADSFSKMCKDMEQFFAKDYKHLEKFSKKETESIQYVVLSAKGIQIGFNKEYEVVIPWEDFLQYVYKDLCGY